MKIRMEIDCNTKAFTGACDGTELAWILRETADEAQDADLSAESGGAIHDSDGIEVGTFEIID